MSRRVAVISTNDKPDYIFYLPIVVEGWFKLGYDVHLFTTHEITHNFLLFETMKKVSDKYINQKWVVTLYKDIEGIDHVTIIQCSRLFASYHYDEDVRLITSDVDMLVTKDIFQDKGLIDCYGRDLTSWHYPMCYISMTASKWREVMGIDMSQSLEQNMERIIKAEPYHNSTIDWERWGTDQEIITKKLNCIKGFVYHHDRGIDLKTNYPKGRLDRSGWVQPDGEIIDVHLPRNPLQHYNDIVPLCGEWFENYFKEFKQLYEPT